MAKGTALGVPSLPVPIRPAWQGRAHGSEFNSRGPLRDEQPLVSAHSALDTRRALRHPRVGGCSDARQRPFSGGPLGQRPPISSLGAYKARLLAMGLSAQTINVMVAVRADYTYARYQVILWAV